MSDLSDNNELYSIGALSNMVGLPIDTLRYYDQIGLFKPFCVSQETGYRYYSVNQAPTLMRIIELKEYGFSLNEIKKFLNQAELSLTDVYQNRYWELIDKKRKLQNIIDKLSKKIKSQQEVIIMNKKVMIVDDAPFMRKICRDLLVKEGYDIVGEAADGPEAFEMYENLRPDLILLDITMPTWDGIYTLSKLKELYSDVNAVMLSAMGQSRIVIESLMAGARNFVVKPFQAETLLMTIKDSFQSEKVFNQEILKQIHAHCLDDSYVLSQAEVDNIIHVACSNADNDDISTIITSLGEKGPDPVLSRLDKLEQDMEEIKFMLKQISTK